MKKRFTLFLLASITLMAACQSDDLSLNGPAKKGGKSSKTLKTRSEQQPGPEYSDLSLTRLSFPKSLLTLEANRIYDIRSIAFSPDGQHIALATSDLYNPIRLTMVKFNKFDRSFSKMNDIPINTYDGWLNSVSYSPDGMILAVGNSNTPFGVSLFKRSGDAYTQLKIPLGSIYPSSLYCHFSQGGNFLITGGARNGETTGVNRIVKRTGSTSFTTVTGVYTDSRDDIADCTISPDEKYFIFFSYGSSLDVFKYNASSDTFSGITLPYSISPYGNNGCFSPDSRFLAIGNNQNSRTLNILKVENEVFTSIALDRIPSQGVVKCLFSPNGQFLFVITDTELWIYKRNGDEFDVYNIYNTDSDLGFSYAITMSISPDGTTLLFSSRTNEYDDRSPIAAFDVTYN